MFVRPNSTDHHNILWQSVVVYHILKNVGSCNRELIPLFRFPQEYWEPCTMFAWLSGFLEMLPQ